jgi:hypothetical protein
MNYCTAADTCRSSFGPAEHAAHLDRHAGPQIGGSGKRNRSIQPEPLSKMVVPELCVGRVKMLGLVVSNVSGGGQKPVLGGFLGLAGVKAPALNVTLVHWVKSCR